MNRYDQIVSTTQNAVTLLIVQHDTNYRRLSFL